MKPVKFEMGTREHADRAAAELQNQPISGQFWKHYKGGEYEIVGVGLNEADLTPVVIYRACLHGREIWVRPVTNFMGSADENGYIPRFVRISR